MIGVKNPPQLEKTRNQTNQLLSLGSNNFVPQGHVRLDLFLYW